MQKSVRLEGPLDSGSLVAFPLNTPPENAMLEEFYIIYKQNYIFCWGLLTFWNVLCKIFLKFTQKKW